MLAFAKKEDRSAWLQAHARDPKKFKCNQQWHRYYLVEDQFEPDMGICFGYDPNNDAYFISDNVPTAIRTKILQIEYYRIKIVDQQSHECALRLCLQYDVDALLIQTLTTFYGNLCAHFEHGEQTLESQDAKAALDYLRSLS